MRKATYPVLGLSLLLAACNGGGDTTKPTVSLSVTAPTTPGKLSLRATATDASGISKVQFYQGNTLLGEDLTAPYTLDTIDVDQRNNGTFTFTAKATDTAGNVGEASTTATININTLYQGQYQWVFFTDSQDIEGSLVAEGVAIFNDQFVNGDNKLMGSGAFMRTTAPELIGDASLGPILYNGTQYLANFFFYPTNGADAYLEAEDANGQFDDVLVNGVTYHVFLGGASIYDASGTTLKDGYLLMMRTSTNPFATASLSALSTANISLTSFSGALKQLSTSSLKKGNLLPASLNAYRNK